MSADLREDKSDSWADAWFRWRVIWTILRNLIFLALLLLAYDKMQSTFEVTTLSLLVLIMQGVTWSDTARTRMDIEECLIQRRISFRVLEKLGEDMTEAENVISDLEKNTYEAIRSITSISP